MGHVEATTTVNAPLETVWNCLNDIDHTPEWVTGLKAAEITTPGTFGAGSIYIDHNQLGPFPQTTPWHVTVFEPMTHQIHESESKTLPSTMTLNLSPAPEGTRVQFVVDYHFLPRLGAVGRLLETLVMNRMLKQVLSQNLASLNSYLQRTSKQTP